MKRVLIAMLVLFSAACSLVEDITTVRDVPNPEMTRGISAFDMANYPAALSYLTGPAERGNTDAQYMIGMIYLHGLAGEKNSYMAQKWLTLAAQDGQKAAQEQLAFLYRDATTPLYNPVNAYQWFSVIIGDNPQYRDKLQNLEWILRTNGLLSTAQVSMPHPKKKLYNGLELNYNSLFPLR